MVQGFSVWGLGFRSPSGLGIYNDEIGAKHQKRNASSASARVGVSESNGQSGDTLIVATSREDFIEARCRVIWGGNKWQDYP